jgi:xylan 1,4-beta-xylosidase
MMKDGGRTKPDVSALASLDRRKLAILVWHYHDDDVAAPAAAVELSLSNLPLRFGTVRQRHFRIDGDHSNAFAAWQRMGSPQQPTPAQYVQLEKAGQLAALAPAESIRVKDGRASIQFTLPRQGVSLLVLEW